MRMWSLLLALLLGSAACGGSDGEAATPSTTEAPSTTGTSTTATTAEVDPFTVPDDPADIDEAYVEAVINEHNRVIGDALRIQLDGGDPKEIIDRYNAIYVPEVADLYLTDVFNETDESLADYKRPPGDLDVEVIDLVEVTSSCVKAAVRQDSSALLIEARPPFDGVIVLRQVYSDGDEAELNLTAWISEGLEPPSAGGESSCGE